MWICKHKFYIAAEVGAATLSLTWVQLECFHVDADGSGGLSHVIWVRSYSALCGRSNTSLAVAYGSMLYVILCNMCVAYMDAEAPPMLWRMAACLM